MKKNAEHIVSLLENGTHFHDNGDYVKAKNCFKNVLKLDPRNSEALLKLGFLQFKAGKIQKSIRILKSSVDLEQQDITYWTLFLTCLASNDRNFELEIVLKKAIEIFGPHQQIQEAIKPFKNVSGMVQGPSEKVLKEVFKISGDQPTETEVQGFLNLLDKYPNSAILKNLYGCFLNQIGQPSNACKFFERAVALVPTAFEYSLNLGLAQVNLAELDAAFITLSKLEARYPLSAELAFHLGKLFVEIGKFEDAFLKFERCLHLDPKFPNAKRQLAFSAPRIGQLDSARGIYFDLLRSSGGSFVDLINYGAILVELRRYNEAKAYLSDALKLGDESPSLYNNLGLIALAEGKFSKAASFFQQAITLDPNYSEAFLHLTLSKQLTSTNKIVVDTVNRLQTSELSISNRSNFYFGLGNIFDESDECEQAFQFYLCANRLKSQLRPYDMDQERNFFDDIKKFDTSLTLDFLPEKFRETSLTPIFIVGMPRSGTTLVEQILSGHTEVETAGELNDVSSFCRQAVSDNCFPDQTQILKFLDGYYSKLKKFGNNSPFVIDKLPGNFKYINIILKLFPDARIVHVNRAREAVCWSNFKQPFTAVGNGFSNSLKDVVVYFDLYKDLMRYWDKEFKDRIYNLSYEKLTDDPNTVLKDLLEFIGIAYEHRCLETSKRQAFIPTASQSQVRKPIYKRSSEDWLRYSRMLGPYLNNNKF